MNTERSGNKIKYKTMLKKIIICGVNMELGNILSRYKTIKPANAKSKRVLLKLPCNINESSCDEVEH
jgi:hypothetical protein